VEGQDTWPGIAGYKYPSIIQDIPKTEDSYNILPDEEDTARPAAEDRLMGDGMLPVEDRLTVGSQKNHASQKVDLKK